MTPLFVFLAGALYFMSENGTVAGASKVVGLFRAKGVHPDLLSLLDEWERHGPFTIIVAPDGGLRTDAGRQAQLFAEGKTKALLLRDTPHGRGAALDLYPYIGGRMVLEDKSLFAKIGAFAKSRGFDWGGDFFGFYDGPHVEKRGWRSLPFPPNYVA